jgi:hypothetical protein
MTVENSGVIDGMGISKKNGDVVLMISDHLTWENEAERFSALERKIGNYIQFSKTQNLVEALPAARGRPVRIQIVYQFEPTETASKFLRAATEQLESLGFGLTYGLLPEPF